MWNSRRNVLSLPLILAFLLLAACANEKSETGAPLSDALEGAEQAEAGAVEADDPAGKFFLDSNVRVNFTQGQFWLRLETPVPVLCAVNYGPAGGSVMELAAMDMTAPATDHDLQLQLALNTTFEFELTAFTKNHQVFRSSVYTIQAKEDDAPDLDLVTSVGDGARVMTELDLCNLKEELAVFDVLATSASLAFASSVPTLASSAYGPAPALGTSRRASGTSPFTEHSLDLLALEPSTKYRIQTLLIDEDSTVCVAGDINFTTLQEESDPNAPALSNVALLSAGAFISGVSSNWGGSGNDGSFGADSAIDGDDTTEWSSDSDGDDAWLEVSLPEPTKIIAIGFWTRTMGTSAQISRFSVTSPGQGLLGEFDLPDAKGLFVFEVPATTTDSLRFEVITSSGGNTGARTIEIYAAAEDER